ncbi:MAG TPA: hypothetical protein VF636_10110 [Sphingomonas sp.]|jgi:hypothetical protein
MRNLFVVLLLASPATAQPGQARCSAATLAGAPAAPAARAKPLGEMPPARAVLSVHRRVAGCPVLLVRKRGRIVEEPVGRPDARRVFTP